MGNRAICCAADDSTSLERIESSRTYATYKSHAKRNRSMRRNTETHESSDLDYLSVEEKEESPRTMTRT